MRFTRFSFGLWPAMATLVFWQPLDAQLTGFSKEDLIKYTADSPYERFEDGRPKVPDRYIEALRNSSSEMVYGPLRRAGFPSQWVDGWQILQPDKKLVGRVFTAQFMPTRPDVNDVIEAEANTDGMLTGVNVPVQIGHTTVMPGDVVLGDREGLTFIPASVVADVARSSKLTELHDVWTKAKFATGKYKASDLYPSPKDPALKKEFEEWRDAELAKLGMEPPPSEGGE